MQYSSRNQLLTNFVQVLDFGAVRDGVPESERGRRIVVDVHGNEITDAEAADDGDELVA